MEMNRVYMSVSITTYEWPNLEFDCTFWERLDGGEMTSRKLTLDEARKMMWELKLAGAEKKMEINPYNPKISYREVTYWARR